MEENYVIVTLCITKKQVNDATSTARKLKKKKKKKKKKDDAGHLVFIDCGVMSSEAIRPMIYCVMCCEYVGPRERTEKTMNCCIYSYFCLVKFN